MGIQSPGEKQSPPQTSVGCSHSHFHHLVQYLPGGNIVSVYLQKNADGGVVVVLNSTWYIVQYFFNTFSALGSGPEGLRLRGWLLFVLRTVLGRQEGINVETQRQQQSTTVH